ncbi:MAG TPA: septal ring lytic transglycosylase RlpA family protein [Terriglobia bacterium]|nr:septal ring lytic transglycosylase RlpA family protein [Terriglobia bacterium]
MRLHSPAARIGLAMAVLLSATGCLHPHKPAAPSAHRVPSPAAPIIQGEEGIASWYGHPYHGRQAASGEIYNMYDMTAAHRTLPFGTQVRVHDLENGCDVQVRINDRGPFVEGRIIDLSYAAAQAMGMNGIARVRLEILGLGTTTEPGVFAVQVGAFRDPANAERLKALIEASFAPVEIQTFDRGDGIFYRVRVGHESTEAGAGDLAEKLRNANFATITFVVRMN